MSMDICKPLLTFKNLCGHLYIHHDLQISVDIYKYPSTFVNLTVGIYKYQVGYTYKSHRGEYICLFQVVKRCPIDQTIYSLSVNKMYMYMIAVYMYMYTYNVSISVCNCCD